MTNYENYEQACERIRANNQVLLAEFEQYLLNKNLKAKTIKAHLQNIDFYINEFLLYEDVLLAEEGIVKVDFFLGYWFIRKALWSNKTSILSYIASLKKFYYLMSQRGNVKNEDYELLKEIIAENKNKWLLKIERYNNFSLEDRWEF